MMRRIDPYQRRSNDRGLESVKASCAVLLDHVCQWSGAAADSLDFDTMARRAALALLTWAAERSGARPDEIAARVEELLADAARDHLVAAYGSHAGPAASRLARRLVAGIPAAADDAELAAARKALML